MFSIKPVVKIIQRLLKLLLANLVVPSFEQLVHHRIVLLLIMLLLLIFSQFVLGHALQKFLLSSLFVSKVVDVVRFDVEIYTLEHVLEQKVVSLLAVALLDFKGETRILSFYVLRLGVQQILEALVRNHLIFLRKNKNRFYINALDDFYIGKQRWVDAGLAFDVVSCVAEHGPGNQTAKILHVVFDVVGDERLVGQIRRIQHDADHRENDVHEFPDADDFEIVVDEFQIMVVNK